VYGDVHEEDINLAAANRVAALIEADDTLDVQQTRTLDISVSFEDRIETAHDAGAVVYLSIQSNASSFADAVGVETLVSDEVAADDFAWQSAGIVQSSVVTATEARDRGVRSQDLYLHRAQMPAALLEIGFLSNDEERAKLLDPEYQQMIAKAVYEGIITYIDHAPPSFLGPQAVPADTSNSCLTTGRVATRIVCYG